MTINGMLSEMRQTAGEPEFFPSIAAAEVKTRLHPLYVAYVCFGPQIQVGWQIVGDCISPIHAILAIANGLRQVEMWKDWAPRPEAAVIDLLHHRMHARNARVVCVEGQPCLVRDAHPLDALLFQETLQLQQIAKSHPQPCVVWPGEGIFAVSIVKHFLQGGRCSNQELVVWVGGVGIETEPPA